mmetsp:Transcript_17953/g.50384  ORF Transcript_17953/g.50384 Transcript_17953/m.50384 type:complete len:681 (+) Transcript_17953:57-2099(+)
MGEESEAYWESLEQEVRGLMEGATAEEGALSSDDEGAEYDLLHGVTLSWARRSRGSALEPPPHLRAESKLALGGDAFRGRLAATFDSLPSRADIAAAAPHTTLGRVGPAFSRQCEGHRLEEPESIGSWQAIIAQEARLSQEQEEEDDGSGSLLSCAQNSSLPQMARRATITTEGTADEIESDEDDWDEGWEDPDGLRGGSSDDEAVRWQRNRASDDSSQGNGHAPAGRPAGASTVRQRAGVSEEDVAEWSMHTASWAKDVDDSDEEDVLEMRHAAARSAACRMAAATTAGGLAPSTWSASSVTSSGCTLPAFGGIDDLEELNTNGGVAPSGATEDSAMQVNMEPPADDPAQAPSDALKRGPPLFSDGKGDATSLQVGDNGGAKRMRLNEMEVDRMNPALPTAGSLGLGASDPYIRELLNAGRRNDSTPATASGRQGCEHVMSALVSGFVQGTHRARAGSTSQRTVSTRLAGFHQLPARRNGAHDRQDQNVESGGLGAPVAMGDASADLLRQRAGFTHYSLDGVEAASEASNLEGLSQMRAILGSQDAVGSKLSDAGIGSVASMESGRHEASFGRRLPRSSGSAGCDTRRGRSLASEASPLVRLEHLNDEADDSMDMVDVDSAVSAGLATPLRGLEAVSDQAGREDRARFSRGRGAAATARRFRRPFGEMEAWASELDDLD